MRRNEGSTSVGGVISGCYYMTSKKAANIQIANILSFYTPQRLRSYSAAALRQ